METCLHKWIVQKAEKGFVKFTCETCNVIVAEGPEAVYDGPKKAPCEHVSRDYIDCKNGEATWECKACGDLLMQYSDTCSGG